MDYVVVLDDNIIYLVCDHGFARLVFSSTEVAEGFSRFIEDKIKKP
ncbi:hypothetical protein [Enterococcus sp. LJL99]